VRLPLEDPQAALKIIQQAIAEDWWSQRIDIIKQMKEKILNEFTNIVYGGTHFHPRFCQIVYNISYKSKWNLEVVDLSNLSEFIEEKLHRIEFNKNDYDFHNDPTFKTKEDVWDRCISLYPDLMNKLVELTKKDILYYDALLGGNKNFINLI